MWSVTGEWPSRYRIIDSLAIAISISLQKRFQLFIRSNVSFSLENKGGKLGYEYNSFISGRRLNDDVWFGSGSNDRYELVWPTRFY